MAHDLKALYWSNEQAKCEQDLAYLMRAHLRIRGKSAIGNIPVIPNRVQTFATRKAAEQMAEVGLVRMVVGKARQVTFTTWSRAYAFQQTAFANDRAAIMVAHDEDTAPAVFGLDRAFYQHLPNELKPRLDRDTMTDLSFPARRSMSIARHAKNLNVGAASAYHVLHFTEASRVAYKSAAQIQASLFPTLSDAPGSVGIIESTSVYGGDWYRDFAESAMKGENGHWRFYFIPWSWQADYVAPVPKGFTPSIEEKDLVKRYGLSREQLAWRRLTRSEYRRYPALFQSAYPLSWDESWVLPENAFRAFNDQALAWQQKQLQPGRWASVSSEGLKEGPGGAVTIWAYPEAGVFYDFGVDPSGSQSEQADYSAGVIVRRDTLEQVAQFKVHLNPASVEFLDLVYWLGMAYNAAQLIPDATGGWGVALLNELRRRSYPNLWRWRRRLDPRERDTQQEGFVATTRDKAFLVHSAAGILEREECIVHSESLWDELVNYMAIALEQWEGRPTDDLVFAFMLALLAARDSSAGVAMGPALPQTEAEAIADVVAAKPWAYHDIVNDLEDRHPVLVNLEPWR